MMVWVPVPADVAAAWAPAQTWPATPAGFVVGGGEVNGGNAEAAADAPAYSYIAPASWAHISPYSASVAAIAGVFWPRMFVATSDINRARLAATIGGGTAGSAFMWKALATVAKGICIALATICGAGSI